MNIRPEFKVHILNESGKQKAHKIAQGCSELLDLFESLGVTGRELAQVRTDLENACFHAKRGMASLPENQE